MSGWMLIGNHKQESKYRVIRDANSIFWEVIVSVFVRKISSYEKEFNSEWLLRQSCLNLQLKKHVNSHKEIKINMWK
jgi:hypothetical protein